jgi:hypothetical protein
MNISKYCTQQKSHFLMGFGTGIIIIYGSFSFFSFFFPFVQSIISFTIKISSLSLSPWLSWLLRFGWFLCCPCIRLGKYLLINAEFDYHLILMMIMVLRTSWRWAEPRVLWIKSWAELRELWIKSKLTY